MASYRNMTNNVTPILQESDFYIPTEELKEIFQEVRIQMNHESYSIHVTNGSIFVKNSTSYGIHEAVSSLKGFDLISKWAKLKNEDWKLPFVSYINKYIKNYFNTVGLPCSVAGNHIAQMFNII